jgi:ketosteroid isomerase-like protein
MTAVSLLSLEQRLSALEAQGEIRRVISRYMELCDSLSPQTDLDELGALFASDAIWQGAGRQYASDFGGHIGRAAIVSFLANYCDPPHFASNVHLLTSENIAVDGDVAEASWIMLQLPQFADGQSFVLAARLSVTFQVSDGRWRIARFQTTNLINRPVDGSWQSGVPLPIPSERKSR